MYLMCVIYACSALCVLNMLVQRFEPEGNALQISIIIIILKNEVCGVVCTLEAALINQFDGTKQKIQLTVLPWEQMRSLQVSQSSTQQRCE